MGLPPSHRRITSSLFVCEKARIAGEKALFVREKVRIGGETMFLVGEKVRCIGELAGFVCDATSVAGKGAFLIDSTPGFPIFCAPSVHWSSSNTFLQIN